MVKMIFFFCSKRGVVIFSVPTFFISHTHTHTLRERSEMLEFFLLDPLSATYLA